MPAEAVHFGGSWQFSPNKEDKSQPCWCDRQFPCQLHLVCRGQIPVRRCGFGQGGTACNVGFTLPSIRTISKRIVTDNHGIEFQQWEDHEHAVLPARMSDS